MRLLKANLSFKSTSPKPHLNRTGSVFALPRNSLSMGSEQFVNAMAVHGLLLG